eukprot:m.76737 g.76737  ORF g.76737 m.76737 type:complete len:249 (-) comp12575_c0_seq4:1135-1881(-)
MRTVKFLELCLLLLCMALSQRVVRAALRKELSDEDLARLEAEWDKDEEEDEDDPRVIHEKKMRQQPSFNPADLDMNDPNLATKMMAAQKKGQTVMIFTSFNKEQVKSKAEMEEISGRWIGMLMNNHLEIKAYPIEDDKMLYVIDDGSRLPELQDFLVGQKEVDYLEIDQKKTYGKFSWSKKHKKKAEKLEEQEKKEREKKQKRIKKRQEKEEKLKKKGKDAFKANLKKKPTQSQTKKSNQETKSKDEL